MTDQQGYMYLMCIRDCEDIKKIDDAIKKGNLTFDKLGTQTYLAGGEGDSTVFHSRLSDQFGITGQVQYIRLPHPEING